MNTKTGNRKCWHIVDRNGAKVPRPMPLTKTQAESGARYLEWRDADGNPDGFVGPFRACLDGCHFVPCTGEAHSNAYIDHCGICAPNWGVVMVPDYCATLDDWRDEQETRHDLPFWIGLVRDE